MPRSCQLPSGLTTRNSAFSRASSLLTFQHLVLTLARPPFKAGALFPLCFGNVGRQHQFPSHLFSFLLLDFFIVNAQLFIFLQPAPFQLVSRPSLPLWHSSLKGGTMPLTERDPNISGRNSRASNISGSSKGYQKTNIARSDLLSAAPGVMSMLRTSTELGDIGTLTFDSSHLPSMPRQQRRSGTTSRMSTGSSHSQGSRRTPNHNAWPSGSSNPRGSLTTETNIPQFLPDTLSPTLMNIPGVSPLVPHSRLSRDGRSFSLTHVSQPSYALSSHRSYTSLRNHDSSLRPRSPYRYPTRLRHPTYRPGSPALSDVTGVHPRRVHGHPYGPRKRNPSLQSNHSDDRIRMPHYRARSRSNASSSGNAPLFIEQVRRVRTPALGSNSSRSTNPHTDSEAPSSDSPSSFPPTPKDGSSMEVLLSPTSTSVLVNQLQESVKAETSRGPLYYDYSEQFDRDALCEPEPEAIPMGFVHRIKTILEERGANETTLPQSNLEAQKAQKSVEPPVLELVELPASPVARRITRHMVLAALEPGSTTDDMTTLPAVAKPLNRASIHGGEELDESCTVTVDPPVSLIPDQEKSPSVISESSSRKSEASAPNSTIDFALLYSKMDEDEELTQQGDAENVPKDDIEGRADKRPSIKTGHSSKFSDAKSFKSCKESDAKSSKESDGKSFKTAKDTVTPDRGTSSVPVMGSKPFEKSSSRLSLRPGSASVLASSVVDNVPQLPSVIPHRESSSSKEAQRSQAVADFLMRLSRPRMFSRHSAKDDFSEKKTSKVDGSSKDKTSEKRASRVASLVEEEKAESRRSVKIESITEEESSEKKPAGVESTLRNSASENRRSRSHSLSRDHITERRVSRVESFQNVHTHLKKSTGGQSMLSIDSFKKHHTRLKSLAKGELAHRESVGEERATSLEMQISELEDIPAPTFSAREHRTPFDSPSVYVTDAPTPTFSEGPQHLSARYSAPHDNAYRDSNTTTHLVWNARKTQFPIPIEALNANVGHRRSEDDSTTDLRLSAFRYPAAYLPDVKEDLHEDSSVNTSASNMKSAALRHPLGRLPSMRASMDECRVLKHPSINSFRKGALARTRNLPSLNFSQMDLFAKLNEALDTGAGASKSMDYAEEYRELFLSPLGESNSSGEIREKYKSLFGGLDEYLKSADIQPDTPIFDFVASHQSNLVFETSHQPLSNEEFIAEIDNLTIPTLGGLTQRLSEFLPSFKRYYQGDDQGSNTENPVFEHALEQLSEVGLDVPPLNTVRSSARLRPMPGHQQLLVMEDGLYEKLAAKEAPKEEPVEAEEQARSSSESIRSKASSHRNSKTPLAELEAPMPLLLRTRSLSLGGFDDFRASFESTLRRRSLRSLVSSPTETRPWNLDKNYPWADTIPPIDISLPSPTPARDAARPGPSRLRRMSGSSDETHTDSEAEELPAASAVEDTTCEDPFRHARKFSKQSVVGSISRRIGLFDNNGYPTGPDSLRNDDRSVDPGDRYPTTGLTPPSAFNVDEVNSFFSDDSSHRNHVGIFRKRLTHLRSKRPLATRSHSAVGTRSLPDADVGPSGSQSGSDSEESSLHTFDGTVGMSKIEFRARKVVERIKTMWFKSGDLFRNLSVRSNTTSMIDRSEYRQGSEVYSGT
ncbi:hypothetical protein BU16DRAFT_198870 [Lophium mytilinum]|uniref:Uncharacterized protein n=1 Tax=Lophium mytilinum TaxID=390894 RepID=A0A6A6R9U1_9PEZI|nr:hypothetical protein BU16DRAFT_198870 [Lophium mytilinum]